MSLCRHHNSPTGCRLAAKCGYKHELYCTNEICVKAGKQHTHTLETCGRMGGGDHERWINDKREKAIAKKAAAKAAKAAEEVSPEEAEEAKQEAAMLRDLYEAAAEILAVLMAIEDEGRNEGEDENEIHDEKVEEAIVTDEKFAPTGWVPEEEQPNNQAAE